MTSKPAQRNKVLLFIHGVRNDDRDANWRRTLDEALLREGTESLEARGYQVIAPSYLAQLEGTCPGHGSGRLYRAVRLLHVVDGELELCVRQGNRR